MLKPKKTKYKLLQKGKLKYKNTAICFLSENKKNTTKLISLQTFRLTAKQLEAAQLSIVKSLKRGTNKLELKVFPDLAVTKKPNEVRMGKGKGSVEFWTCRVYKGTILFEIYGGNNKNNKDALITGSKKLPIQTIIKDVNA